MSVMHPQPPASALQALAQALNVHREPRHLHEILQAAHQHATHPHRVYMMDSQAMAAGSGLDKAHLVAWRFLVTTGSGGHAAVELPCRADDTGHQFGTADLGPLVQGTLDALQAAERQMTAAGPDYEVALLRIPALYVQALWLRSVDGQDRLIPLAPAQLVRANGTGLMTQLEFLGALAGEARRLHTVFGAEA